MNAKLPLRFLLSALVLAPLAVVTGCSSGTNDDQDAARADAMMADGSNDAAEAGLHWYRTCGDPICRSDDAGVPSGASACTTEKPGEACTASAATCDPGEGCGVLLRCADRDPRVQTGGCPISRKAYKREIHYLAPSELKLLEAQTRALRLAHYRYNDAPDRERLGFMIDDAPGSPALDEPRDMIDLYAYTSMVVATVQRQAARLDEQGHEIAQLRAQLHKLATKR